MVRRLNTREMSLADLRAAVVRPDLAEVAVAPAVESGIERIFGARLTPLEVVNRIIADVAARGDAAVVEYARRIDGVELTAETLFVSEAEVAAARRDVPADEQKAIAAAIEQVQAFHLAQKRQSYLVAGAGGATLGQRLLPLERVACYAPGGRAPLVSTAYMAVVPARVAGVREIIAATPAGRTGQVDARLLLALTMAGAHRILRVGGAQAVAALAYGTQTIPRVDKITGPGNVFVQLAKKQVFGRVGIDALQGPSEIVIVAGEEADPVLVAADLLSQAEHDPEAAAILLTPSSRLLETALAEMERQVAVLPRRETASASLQRWGRAVLCRDLAEAFDLCNIIAPEHLEIHTADPWRWLARVQHAGAVFLGPHSPEPIGDYVAGTNHILPTNGTARFSSPLGVDDFIRRSSIVSYTPEALQEMGPAAVRIGEIEGLEAHAQAVRLRLARLMAEGGASS